MHYNNIIAIRTIERPPETWYDLGQRARMITALRHAQCTWPALHHLDTVYLHITTNDPIFILERTAEISGVIARVFLSRLRVCVHHQGAEHIIKLVAARAKNLWQRRAIQEDLFEGEAIYTMPEWFSVGEWIIPLSTE